MGVSWRVAICSKTLCAGVVQGCRATGPPPSGAASVLALHQFLRCFRSCAGSRTHRHTHPTQLNHPPVPHTCDAPSLPCLDSDTDSALPTISSTFPQLRLYGTC
eukprot:303858-Chlamydomonas_euryale.AAC.5